MPKNIPELEDYDDESMKQSDKEQSNKVPTELVDNIINETTKRIEDDGLL